MSDKFSSFDLIGIVGPGTILLLGLAFLFPDMKEAFIKSEFTVGEFGIFLLVAFVVGQFVQAAASVFQDVWWYFRDGVPTDWVRMNPPGHISEHQQSLLFGAIKNFLRDGKEIETLPKSEWDTVIRTIYSKVHKAGRSSRVDLFNMTHVLMRGLLVTFLGLAATIAAYVPEHKNLLWPCLFFAALSGWRMDMFGRKYARELFVEFLNLSHQQQTTP